MWPSAVRDVLARMRACCMAKRVAHAISETVTEFASREGVTSFGDAIAAIDPMVEVLCGEWHGQPFYIRMLRSDLERAHPNITAAARKAGVL